MPEKARLNEQFVKGFTGGDNQRGRGMWQNEIEFAPTWKLFLSCNLLPAVEGNNHGTWRRIKVIPFTVTFEKAADKVLGMDKRIIGAELPGVLNRLLEGCRDWRDNGLGSCTEVEDASKKYRSEQDVVLRWFRCSCRAEPGTFVPLNVAKTAFQDWATASGEQSLINDFKFAAALRSVGVDRGMRWVPTLKDGKKDRQRIRVYEGMCLVNRDLFREAEGPKEESPTGEVQRSMPLDAAE
jgi:P4 family phage/plasmid primase-like protien